MIQGFAKDTTNGKQKIRVVVVDGFENIHLAQDLHLTASDSDHISTTDKDGYFEIYANVNSYIYFQSRGHKAQSYQLKYLLTRGEINIVLEPKGCKETQICFDKPKSIYALVAKKIDVKLDTTAYCGLSFYSRYKAKYEVLENIYGNYAKSIIEFESFEHARFENYYDFDVVVLYIADYCGKLIHLRGEYDPLYKNSLGEYASPYSAYLLKTTRDNKLKERHKPMNFRGRKANTAIKHLSKEIISKEFPDSIYEVKNNYAKPLYGLYPDDLFDIRKLTTLKEHFSN